jgi:hypothetical protein
MDNDVPEKPRIPLISATRVPSQSDTEEHFLGPLDKGLIRPSIATEPAFRGQQRHEKHDRAAIMLT